MNLVPGTVLSSASTEARQPAQCRSNPSKVTMLCPGAGVGCSVGVTDRRLNLSNSPINPLRSNPYRSPPGQITIGIFRTTPGCSIVTAPRVSAANTSSADLSSCASPALTQVTWFNARNGL